MYNYVIIDDEDIIRKGTIKKLQGLADQIQCIGEASDGAMGLEMIQELNPDFVILDMQMPNMDGMELLPKLAGDYPDLPLIVISGFKDFDYIKQAMSANAIEYLLKPFSREDIQKNVTKIIEILETRHNIEFQITDSKARTEQAYYEYDIKLLNDQLLGYHSGEIKLNSSRLSILNSYEYDCIAIYYSDEIARPNINDWLMGMDLSDLSVYLEIPNSSLGFLLLFHPAANSVSRSSFIRNTIEPLSHWLTSQGVSVPLGISDTMDKLSELHTAYVQSLEALNLQHPFNKESLIFSYDKEAVPHRLNWDAEDEFLFRIEACMTDEILTLLTQLFDMYRVDGDTKLMDLKYHCRMLSDKCNDIVNYYLQSENQVQSSSSMQQMIEQIFSAEELFNYHKVFFTNVSTLLSNKSVYNNGDSINKIQAYINRNYQKNITQDLLSSYFYINRSYLSTLFKERTGSKFVDYLNDVRIEKSKQLLATSNLKMYQVAKNVGYDNVKYFFRIFKKKTGVTPEIYRQENYGE